MAIASIAAAGPQGSRVLRASQAAHVVCAAVAANIPSANKPR
jgi:hypothetical protein